MLMKHAKFTLIFVFSLFAYLGNTKAEVITIPSGSNIQTAIDTATSGDTLILADGGEYTGGITINKSIIIKSVGASKLPVITTSGIGLDGGMTGYYFELEGIEINGNGAQHMMSMLAGGDSCSYFKLSNLYVHDFQRTILRMDQATAYVDSVVIDDCHFYNNDAGGWNVLYWRDDRVFTKYLSVTNTTADGFNEGVLRFDGTFQKKIYIDNCTFNNRNSSSGSPDANPLFDVNGPAGTVFKMTNCIMTDIKHISVPIFGIDSVIADTIINCRFFFDETTIDTTHTWDYKSEFIKEDPDYYNPSKGNLTLPSGSPLLTASTTGGIIGDPRWMPSAPPANLVAYYSFDDKDIENDTIVLDQIRTSDGEVERDTAVWITGAVGEALDLNAMADSASVEVPDATAIDFSGANSFSISVLIKTQKTNLSGTDMILVNKGSRNTSYGGNGNWYAMYIKEGNLKFDVDDNLTKAGLSAPAPAWYPENDWVHLVAVRDVAKDSLLLYCNGWLQAKILDVTTADIASGLPLTIGNYYSKNNKFPGAMDEVKLFNIALGAGEVEAMADEYGLLYTSTNATLTGITVDGTPLAGFNKDTLEYDVTLPYGTTDVPVVAVTKADPSAIDTITNAASLPGTTTILITAPDLVTKRTYTIHFSVLPYVPSSDATLSALSVGLGTLAPVFNPDSLNYIVNDLPTGTTVVNITATANHDSAEVENPGSVSIVNDSAFAQIVVTAEDGTTRTYSIQFSILVSVEDILANKAIIQYNRKSDMLMISNALMINEIRVINITGKIELIAPSTHREQFTVSTSSLSKGIYIIQAIYTDKSIKSIKITK